jgi:hypothetical protein
LAKDEDQSLAAIPVKVGVYMEGFCMEESRIQYCSKSVFDFYPLPIYSLGQLPAHDDKKLHRIGSISDPRPTGPLPILLSDFPPPATTTTTTMVSKKTVGYLRQPEGARKALKADALEPCVPARDGCVDRQEPCYCPKRPLEEEKTKKNFASEEELIGHDSAWIWKERMGHLELPLSRDSGWFVDGQHIRHQRSEAMEGRMQASKATRALLPFPVQAEYRGVDPSRCPAPPPLPDVGGGQVPGDGTFAHLSFGGLPGACDFRESLALLLISLLPILLFSSSFTPNRKRRRTP